MNKGVLIGIGVLIAVAVAGFFATRGGYKAPTSTSTLTPTPTTTTTTSGGVEEESPTREITIIGNEYKFSPASMSLTASETVKITFKNTGAMPHNLMISELGVATKTIGGGESDSVVVKADKTGTFAFYCSVSGHRGLGMEGITVVK